MIAFARFEDRGLPSAVAAPIVDAVVQRGKTTVPEKPANKPVYAIQKKTGFLSQEALDAKRLEEAMATRARMRERGF